MEKIVSGKSPLKVGDSGRDRDQGRRVLKTIVVKVYGTGARALFNSGAVLNVLCKGFVDHFGIEPDKKNRRITAVQGGEVPSGGHSKGCCNPP